MPLHRSRRRKRGFNQAEILARELGAAAGIPVRTDVLFRVKKTSPAEKSGEKGTAGKPQGRFRGIRRVESPEKRGSHR